MTPVAVMVGANRVVPAAGIIHPLGNAELSPDEEKALRKRIVEKALQALKNAAEPSSATSEALTLYGRALYLSGNITQAERALQRAVTKMPVDPAAFRYLSETAKRLGHTLTAREAAQQYAALTSAPSL